MKFGGVPDEEEEQEPLSLPLRGNIYAVIINPIEFQSLVFSYRRFMMIYMMMMTAVK